MLTLLILCLFVNGCSALVVTPVENAQMCSNYYVFMCHKTHHPHCSVTLEKSFDMCSTTVVCNEFVPNLPNYFVTSARCYAVDKAFEVPEHNGLRAFDRAAISFNYKVTLIGENGQELDYLQGFDSTVLAQGETTAFISAHQANITEFIIESKYHCVDISVCLSPRSSG